MIAFAVFTLGVSALFGLFAMAFVYTVEDRFLLQVIASGRGQAHRTFRYIMIAKRCQPISLPRS
jgi:hypothetical protein